MTDSVHEIDGERAEKSANRHSVEAQVGCPSWPTSTGNLQVGLPHRDWKLFSSAAPYATYRALGDARDE
jgi:hypothetical protein